ncbi:MAG: hypothetical protein WA985_01240 [Erythrobacter sp.]
MLENSRFNPAPGIKDFWTEFRKPNPYRWPLLVLSAMPFMGLLYVMSGETYYREPERPRITYITTFDPTRTDADIMASNRAHQEVKDLREADEAERAQRKRDLYKALGAAAGMDVEEIERQADEARAAEEAAQEARRDAMFGRASEDAGDVSQGPAASDAPGPNPAESDTP